MEKWTPFTDVAGQYDVDALSLRGGLTLTLVPDGPQRDRPVVTLIWRRFIAFQISEETYREDLWQSSPTQTWAFWHGDHSDYLRHFRETSVLVDGNARHYRIIGTNLVADVLAEEGPVVNEVFAPKTGRHIP